MPQTPEQARATARTAGQLMGRENAGQRQSQSRGRDTIGTGGTVEYPAPDHGKMIVKPGRVEQGERGIGFDSRSNTVTGREKEQPYEAAHGARMVGDAKLGVKAPQHGTCHDEYAGNAKTDHDGRPGAQRFRIEDGNHAKRSARDGT
jgi:hypothetical protein